MNLEEKFQHCKAALEKILTERGRNSEDIAEIALEYLEESVNSECCIIKTSGEKVPFIFEGEVPTLEELQEAVGGYITILNSNYEMVIIANDDGFAMDLPSNPEATKLYLQSEYHKLYLVGDVVYMPSKLIE